jgi:branched-chain amino acid aminotransferase
MSSTKPNRSEDTMSQTRFEIKIEPLPEGEGKPMPEELGFGRHFTNRMFTQKYTPEKGWHDATIGPYRPFSLDPATVVLHYAQEIFEGIKAYRRPDGNINLFRTWENTARFNRSAERMAMPLVDPEAHFEAIIELVRLEHEWVPRRENSSLYIRPTMIATDPALGVHASKSYLHFIILSPVGSYFPGGFNPVSVYISHEYVRAVRGGTGDAKAGGNYAASLYVSERAKKQACQQVLWLDGLERRYVEEVGAMNIAFVYEGERIVTPALSGTILPGITRDSVLRLAPDLGYPMVEDQIDVHEMLKDVASGRITEAFGIGTAAVIAPVGTLCYRDEMHVINENETGPVAKHLFKALTDIQYGRGPDPYGWTHTIKVKAQS